MLQVEKRKLKRKRQREAAQAKYDNEITELAKKAAVYDQLVGEGNVFSDSDFTVRSTTSLLPTISLCGMS